MLISLGVSFRIDKNLLDNFMYIQIFDSNRKLALLVYKLFGRFRLDFLPLYSPVSFHRHQVANILLGINEMISCSSPSKTVKKKILFNEPFHRFLTVSNTR